MATMVNAINRLIISSIIIIHFLKVDRQIQFSGRYGACIDPLSCQGLQRKYTTSVLHFYLYFLLDKVSFQFQGVSKILRACRNFGKVNG